MKKHKILFEIESEIFEQVNELAEKSGLTINEIYVLALREYINFHKDKLHYDKQLVEKKIIDKLNEVYSDVNDVEEDWKK